jgi:hypothetical protein
MNNILWIWNVETLKLTSALMFANNIKSVRWHPKQDLLCIASAVGKLYFWN